jgi:hypothetical protein
MLYTCIIEGIKIGGRKSYPSRNLIGNSSETRKEFKGLANSFSGDEPKKTAQKTLDVFFSSEKAISIHSYATKLTPFILRNIKELRAESDDVLIKREIAKAWQDIKKKNNYSVPKEIDTVIVNNSVKIVRGGKSD